MHIVLCLICCTRLPRDADDTDQRCAAVCIGISEDPFCIPMPAEVQTTFVQLHRPQQATYDMWSAHPVLCLGSLDLQVTECMKAASAQCHGVLLLDAAHVYDP